MNRAIKSAVSIFAAVLCLAAPVSGSAATYKLMKTNVTGLRLRDINTRAVKRTLPKGTRLLYVNKTSGAMYRVVTTNGQPGLVYKEYLSKYGAVNSKSVYQVNKGSTPMYAKASTSSKRSRYLSKNTVVIVYSKNATWAYCKTMEGKAGYIQMSRLKKGAF